MRHCAEQVARLDMVGLRLQNLAIKLFGLPKPAGDVVGERDFEDRLGRGQLHQYRPIRAWAANRQPTRRAGSASRGSKTR